tara:strand:+ start:9498 stop:10946 length:1449 start_codon:yes stop_codon:yes gene_type:complete
MLTPFLALSQQSLATEQEALDVNGVSTMFGPAAMCWDFNDARYEVPKGSSKHSIFAHDLWIGGIDDGGQLRVANQTYNQSPGDYRPGPVSDSIYHNDADMGHWDRVWKIHKSEIDYHILNYTNPAYIIPDVIVFWPAHGDVSMGQSDMLAPFVDLNTNGIYEPFDGDYPDIKGDQAIYFIRNDVGSLDTTSLGLEIHMMIYAYRCDNYPDLNHTVFVNTTLFNRGSHNLEDVYIGTWTDMDLGYYTDDYIGCNVPLNLGYTFNGDTLDEGANGYGINPPAQGLVYLNSIMEKFVYYNNDFTNTGNPESDYDYYNYLRGIWKDNVPMTFGGDGHGSGNGATNNTCSYMFPDATDPSFPTEAWTDSSAGNTPADRRMLMSTGPMDLDIGDSYIFDYAFVFAWDSINGNSLPLLFQYTENIQDFYDGTLTMPCSNINTIHQHHILKDKKLIKIVDVIGREVQATENTPLFFIYEDGSVEKKIIIE